MKKFLFEIARAGLPESGISAPGANPYITAASKYGRTINLPDAIVGWVNFAVGFLVAIAVMLIIAGGIMYLFAGGNEERANKGGKIVIGAVIGIVIVLFGYAIVSSAIGIFG